MEKLVIIISLILFIIQLNAKNIVEITDQNEWDTYVAGLSDNTIPSNDSVVINYALNTINVGQSLIINGSINVLGSAITSINFNVGETFNYGTIYLTSGPARLNVNANAIFNNLGTIDIEGGSGFGVSGISNRGIFNNAGEIYKLSSLSTVIRLDGGIFNNTGFISTNLSCDIVITDQAIFNSCSLINCRVNNAGEFNDTVPAGTICLNDEGNIGRTIDTNCSCQVIPIPTLSQWGIIVLSMIMLIFGVVTLKDSIALRIQGKP